MKIFKHIFRYKGVLAIIVCLLVIQAFCELSLPNYTSDIVDIGIQQGGIEDAATTNLSEQTHDFISMVLAPDDEEFFKSCYDFDRETANYALNDEGYSNRKALSKKIALPMVAGNMIKSQKDYDVDSLLKAYKSGLVQKDVLRNKINEIKNQMENLDDAIIDQQAIVAAKAEYNLLGVDMNAMQMQYLTYTGLMMLLVTAIAMFVSILVGFLAAKSGAKTGKCLREMLYERVLAFSSKEVDKFGAASLITRGTNDIQIIQTVCILFLRVVLYAPILAIGGIIMVSQHTFDLWWVIAWAVVAVFVLIAVLFAITGPKFRVMQKLIDRVNLVAREILTGISVIRAFGREKYEKERFDNANFELTKTQLFTGRTMSFMIPIMTLIMNAVSVLIIWVGAHFVDVGNVQTGDLIAVITYSMLIIMSFLIIGVVAILLPRANVACERHDEIMQCIPSINDPDDKSKDILKETNTKLGVSVEFKDVSFSYDQKANNVLDNVSFIAPEGKTTAIIGATGSGKSTIIALIERFRDVDSGCVLIDGVDVRDLSQTNLRSMLGYVPQKAFLFDGTIDSNVSFSGNTNLEQRDNALKIAEAIEVVEAKDNGINAEIFEGGSNVSGGQRQRLSIARALNTDAKCMLFDDSFSALDYKTDALVRNNLKKSLKGKTSIIVAQRISTVMDADNIVVMDNGKISGVGTHQELLYSSQTYRDIALSQLSSMELFGSDIVPALKLPKNGGENV